MNHWRTWVVLIATTANLAITLALYIWVPSATDITHFWGSVFVSWVGGVLLFAFLGAIVAVLSMNDPNREPLESRLRILFKGQRGAHVEYAVSRIMANLRPYVDTQDIRIEIVDLSLEIGLVKIDQFNKLILKSMLPDLYSEFKSDVGMIDVTPAPIGRTPNQLHYLNIDGIAKGSSERFESKIVRPVNFHLKGDSASTVEYKLSYWSALETEAFRYIPRRYVKGTSLTVGNSLDRDVDIIISFRKSQFERIVLPPNTIKKFEYIRDCSESEPIYELYIECNSSE